MRKIITSLVIAISISPFYAHAYYDDSLSDVFRSDSERAQRQIERQQEQILELQRKINDLELQQQIDEFDAIRRKNHFD